MKQAPATQAAQQRLAQTRRELLRHMGPAQAAAMAQAHGDSPRRATDAQDPTTAAEPPPAGQASAAPAGAWSSLRRAAHSWWRAQPAHLALELGQPVLEKYARAHPVKLLALSAGAGAALVLARPWRLISLTGLLVAALKSAQLSALAAEVLHPGPGQPPVPRSD